LEKQTLVFATNNKHKLEELQKAVGDSFIIKSLKEIGFTEDIEEPFETLEENAYAKSSFINKKFGINCFADDTGLEILALNGEPGVYSARYAGEQCSFEDNMNKVLKKMENIKERKARFRTVISLILNGEEHQFTGIVNGVILESRHGEEGFGYDPIFRPDGFKESFAQMPLAVKNKISHRGLAVKKLIEFLLK